MKVMGKKGFSVVEYVVLIAIVVGAFLVMRSYIQRGIFGMSAQTGQSFAFGRQYDAQKSVDCGFDGITGNWYDDNCFKSLGCALGNSACENNCPGSACSQVCAPTYCSATCGAGTDNCGNSCTGVTGCGDLGGGPSFNWSQ